MLTRVRIEVEEGTAEECVKALWKYEHAIQQQEARRYRDIWPVSGSSEHVNTPEEEYPTPDHDWTDDMAIRDFYNAQLGREVSKEVIEYDASLPGYRGRRVVRFVRTDMRERGFSVRITAAPDRATGSFTTGSVGHLGVDSETRD